MLVCMLAAPWNVILTVVFATTGIYCFVLLFSHRSVLGHRLSLDFNATVIHLTHAVMSVAMTAMCWILAFPAVLNWVQIILFSVLALALVPGLWNAPTLLYRIDLVGHIWLGAAMVWMIAAMPLLMTETGGGGHSSGHGKGGSVTISTPEWVDVVNAVFVAGSLALAFFWVYRAFTIRGERLHALTHCLMAAGMAAMLLLMNE